MESKRGMIFGSGNWARRCKNRGREGKEHFGVANTIVRQGCPEVPGTSKRQFIQGFVAIARPLLL